MKRRINYWIYLLITIIILIIMLMISIGYKIMNKTSLDSVQNMSQNISEIESSTFELLEKESSTVINEINTMESTMQTTIQDPILNTIGDSTQNTTESKIQTTIPDTSSTVVEDFVSDLKIAQSVNQMIVVSANGTTATVTMHEKDINGVWQQIMSTTGFVGSNGVGKASEADTKTPAGVFTLSSAFGVKENPGTAFHYTKVDDSYYWVDDPNSIFYNQFVTMNHVTPDWKSAEHIIDYPVQYAYVIPIDYNLSCVPGEGSAIFLHCSNNKATAGCVSVPENNMIFFLNHIVQGCVIIIDNANAIQNY